MRQVSGAEVCPTMPQAISGLSRSVIGFAILSIVKEVRRHFPSPWFAPLMKIVEKILCACVVPDNEAAKSRIGKNFISSGWI